MGTHNRFRKPLKREAWDRGYRDYRSRDKAPAAICLDVYGDPYREGWYAALSDHRTVTTETGAEVGVSWDKGLPIELEVSHGVYDSESVELSCAEATRVRDLLNEALEKSS